MRTENGAVTVKSAIIRGAGAVPVEVTAVLETGIPGISIVGMADASVVEARSRIRCALRSSGFGVPRGSITVTLSPTDVRKTGTGLDLAIAAAILTASGQMDASALEGRMLYGELRADGGLVTPRGAEAVRQLAAREGAALVTATGARGMRGEFLALDALGGLRDGFLPVRPASTDAVATLGDMGDVPGNAAAKRAIAVAVASGLGVLLLGDEETARGLARRVSGIMPAPDPATSDEIAPIGSITHRPLDGRAPLIEVVPETSVRSLIGGGRPVAPGAVTGAHGGALLVSRAHEMRAPALMSLSAAVREGAVAIVRADGIYRMPARALPVLSAPMCPCGGFGRGECGCAARSVGEYRARLISRTEPIAPIKAVVERGGGRTAGSDELRAAVERARDAASERGGERMVAPEAAGALESLAGNRGRERLESVARVIADMEGSREMRPRHVREAASLLLLS